MAAREKGTEAQREALAKQLASQREEAAKKEQRTWEEKMALKKHLWALEEAKAKPKAGEKPEKILDYVVRHETAWGKLHTLINAGIDEKNAPTARALVQEIDWTVDKIRELEPEVGLNFQKVGLNPQEYNLGNLTKESLNNAFPGNESLFENADTPQKGLEIYLEKEKERGLSWFKRARHRPPTYEELQEAIKRIQSVNPPEEYKVLPLAGALAKVKAPEKLIPEAEEWKKGADREQIRLYLQKMGYTGTDAQIDGFIKDNPDFKL